MTKNEFLLNIAIDAVNWGEGSDFELRELINEMDDGEQGLFEHYGVPHYDENIEDEEGYEDLRDNALDRIPTDVTALLLQLIEKEKSGA